MADSIRVRRLTPATGGGWDGITATFVTVGLGVGDGGFPPQPVSAIQTAQNTPTGKLWIGTLIRVMFEPPNDEG